MGGAMFHLNKKKSFCVILHIFILKCIYEVQ
jgi:hypothetical protein